MILEYEPRKCAKICLVLCRGASMVKWAKIVLQYTNTIMFWVICLKIAAKCCLNSIQNSI